MNDPKTIDEKMNSEQVLLLRKRAASTSKPVMMREQRGICKSAESGTHFHSGGSDLKNQRPVPVNVQDKGAVIERFPGHPPELKWDKQRGDAPAKEPRMKLTTRYGIFAVAFALFAIGASVLSSGAGAQEEGWQILRADYGFRNQRNNVTDILKDLIGRGGQNGRVAVNNQTMGGDPAVGKDKSLRIFARNRRNEEREFNFREGGFVDVRLFEVRRDRDDWDDRGGNYGDRDDWNGVRIIRAYYGIQGRTINVTDLLRSRARTGGLNFVVTNSAFGGDPAVGADKYLIVIYRYQGREAATFVREGNTLTIP